LHNGNRQVPQSGVFVSEKRGRGGRTVVFVNGFTAGKRNLGWGFSGDTKEPAFVSGRTKRRKNFQGNRWGDTRETLREKAYSMEKQMGDTGGSCRRPSAAATLAALPKAGMCSKASGCQKTGARQRKGNNRGGGGKSLRVANQSTFEKHATPARRTRRRRPRRETGGAEKQEDH